MVHNATNTAISFTLLITAVGGSFAYVYSSIEPMPYLGVDGIELSPDLARALEMEQTEGILVTRVDPGSPADKAGLKGGNRVVMINDQELRVGGDVIVAFDGERVTTAGKYRTVLDQKSVGDTLRITVMRSNGAQDIRVVLEERR